MNNKNTTATIKGGPKTGTKLEIQDHEEPGDIRRVTEGGVTLIYALGRQVDTLLWTYQYIGASK